MSVAITAFIKFLTPAAKAAATKGTNLKRQETIALSKAVNKASEALNVPVKEAKIKLKAAAKLPPPSKKPTPSEKAAGAGEYKPRNPNPKLINDPGNVAPKNKRELARLKASQALDDAGTPLKPGRELMTKEQYLNSNPVEKRVGAGSGPNVGGAIMRGKAVTRDQVEDLERMDREGNISIRKRGGTVKRNKGGAVRGVGAATRGFGNASYSNKLY